MGINETLTEHLRNVVGILQEHQLDYALAGGLAYSALVEPRATMDIDLLILLKDIPIEHIFDQLEQYFDAFIIHQTPMQFQYVNIWRTVGYKERRELILDFLLAESLLHQKMLERAISLNFLGTTLKVITLEDLILLKKCANRPQDIADITTIYATYEHEIDHDYLAYWFRELKIT